MLKLSFSSVRFLESADWLCDCFLIFDFSILGGLVMVLGLYSVLWGKSREQILKVSLDLEQSSG